MELSFTDIHCHLVPDIDDGAKDLSIAIDMAEMAVNDGFRTIIATPHQLGNFARNSGDEIRHRVTRLQSEFKARAIDVQVLPGADVRIQDEMIGQLQSGNVLTLADRFNHVLLELPHELYFPLDAVLEQLGKLGLVGILSHPERNHGILANPGVLGTLVKQGCLLQVTAGSLTGSFGPSSQAMAERLVRDRLVHFIATDAHGTRNRRPLMSRAFDRVKGLTDERFAIQICCENPRRVAEGIDVAVHAVRVSIGQRAKTGGWRSWFSSKKAG